MVINADGIYKDLEDTLACALMLFRRRGRVVVETEHIVKTVVKANSPSYGHQPTPKPGPQ